MLAGYRRLLACTRRNLAPLGCDGGAGATDQRARICDTRLEIGDAAEELEVLAASFNELLSRLDQSFDTMRRFVADASHELRTPLSVIRGEADVALSQDRDGRGVSRIAGDHPRRIAAALAAGGRSAEPGARRCRPRQAADCTISTSTNCSRTAAARSKALAARPRY